MSLKVSLFFLILFSIVMNSIAQEFDMNWYVLHGKGLNGDEILSNNADIWSNELTNEFYISGIKHPNHEEASRDDIFVIFKNGSFYSSRMLNNTPWQYGITENEQIEIGLKAEYEVEYLYWTNRYDDDDDPDEIQTQSYISYTPLVELGPSQLLESKKIFANHDVVHDKDIVIILDLNLNLNQHPNSPYFTFFLQFNKLTQHNNYNKGELINKDSVETANDIFNTSHVFGEDKFAYPITTEVELIEDKIKIKVNANTRFVYIVLHGNSRLNTLVSPGGTFDGYNAVFELLDSEEKVIDHIVERTGPIHDPNYFIAKQACVESNTVYYEGSFHNVTEISACNVGVIFSLPNFLDTSTISFTHVTYDGNSVKIDSIRHGIQNRIWIFFDRIVCLNDSMPLEFGVCLKMKANSGNVQDRKREEFIPTQAITVFKASSREPLYYPLSVNEDLDHLIDHPVIYEDIGSYCDKCSKKVLVKCKWYNCSTFWFEDFRWLYGLLGMGLLAGIIYKLLQKDKQRIR